MVIPKGSIVDIGGIGRGALAEDITINLNSNFRSLASDFQNEITQMIDMVGATSRSLFGRGFSSQFKQMTTQIWDKTDPASFNLNVEFHRVPLDNNGPQNVSGENLMRVVKSFCTVPLPAELTGGMLEPPGPSPIEGIGIDEMTGMQDEAAIRGFVNVTIGSMRFNRLLMRKAEPTFNKYVDDSGYPISCRVAFDFISVWAATKNIVNSW
jgi:hypothetical protein